MKFAHMGDCHLGGWRQPELKELNALSFRYALETCISQKVDFILVTGDLFDSAYPPIETLKETFNEFRKVREAGIPVFLIAGSHDYSASGKTFLEVLENSGFCINVAKFEEHKEKLMLHPTLYQNIAIYGYPGKKSGLEVNDIQRIILQDAPGMFKILMLHTAIRDAVGTLPIPAVDETALPKVDYLALSHLHIVYNKEGRVYSGPIFPNNLAELEELHGGSFYIFDNGKITREKIKIKEILPVHIEINDAQSATTQIISYFENLIVKDKIVILHLQGIIQTGKVTDIDFNKIENLLRKRGAFSFIKSTTHLHQDQPEFLLQVTDPSNIEEKLIEKFTESNPNKNNQFISALIRTLQIEQMDEEKSTVFEERLIEDARKALNI